MHFQSKCVLYITIVSGGSDDCYGGGDSFTNADTFEDNNGAFNLTIEEDLSGGSGTFYYVMVFTINYMYI